MTLLVTGSSSYIGRNLIDLLEKKKIHYIGIDINKPYNKNCKKIDITKLDQLKRIRTKIDCIIHLAAVSNERDARNDPFLTYKVNIIGLLNLINLAKVKNIKKFIFASTEWVYENQIKKKHLLDLEKCPNSYSNSKLISEIALKSQNKIKYVILRFGIIYGNRSKNNMSAFDQIIKHLKYSNIIEIGSKKTARSFIHIHDIVRGILAFVKCNNNYIIDLQGPEKISLGYLIKNAEKILKKKVIVKEKNPNKHSIRVIKFTKNKFFTPKIFVKDGINKDLNEY